MCDTLKNCGHLFFHLLAQGPWAEYTIEKFKFNNQIILFENSDFYVQFTLSRMSRIAIVDFNIFSLRQQYVLYWHKYKPLVSRQLFILASSSQTYSKSLFTRKIAFWPAHLRSTSSYGSIPRPTKSHSRLQRLPVEQWFQPSEHTNATGAILSEPTWFHPWNCAAASTTTRHTVSWCYVQFTDVHITRKME